MSNVLKLIISNTEEWLHVKAMSEIAAAREAELLLECAKLSPDVVSEILASRITHLPENTAIVNPKAPEVQACHALPKVELATIINHQHKVTPPELGVGGLQLQPSIPDVSTQYVSTPPDSGYAPGGVPQPPLTQYYQDPQR